MKESVAQGWVLGGSRGRRGELQLAGFPTSFPLRGSWHHQAFEGPPCPLPPQTASGVR